MSEKPIIHNMARCRKCKDIIESTHVHDFKSCKCGAIFVDGGKDYIRRGANNMADIEELNVFEGDNDIVTIEE